MKIAFDVGANNGFHTAWLMAEGYYVHSFEPVEEMCDKIRESMAAQGLSSYTINKLAVSDVAGIRDFNIDKESDWGCSSFRQWKPELAEEWKWRTDFKFCEVRQVCAIRLDDYCRYNGITKIDWLHIDAQAEDLNVLRSLGDMIGIVQGGVLECATDEHGAVYIGMPTMAEVARFLWGKGFEIFKMEPHPTHHEMNLSFRKTP